MDSTTIDIDGIGAKAIAGSVLDSIGVQPDRVTHMEISIGLVNPDGEQTSLSAQVDGAEAGHVIRQMIGGIDWSAVTANRISVEVVFLEEEEATPPIEGNSKGSPGDRGEIKLRNSPTGYDSPIVESPKVDEPVQVGPNTKSYKTLFLLDKYYEGDPISARELTDKANADGYDVDFNKTGSLLSMLYINKAMVDRKKLGEEDRFTFGYMPIQPARDLINEHGEPK